MKAVCHQHDRVGAWVMSRCGGEWFPGRGVTAGLEDALGNLVAGCVFEHFNGTNMFVHMAVREGASLTRGFLYDCFGFCFYTNGCERITSIVDGSNSACQSLVERLGAVLEATLQGAGLNGGDLLVYKMTPASCRFLESQQNGIV